MNHKLKSILAQLLVLVDEIEKVKLEEEKRISRNKKKVVLKLVKKTGEKE